MSSNLYDALCNLLSNLLTDGTHIKVTINKRYEGSPQGREFDVKIKLMQNETNQWNVFLVKMTYW